jgi:transcriptional regulator with XRE-family HTH domain
MLNERIRKLRLARGMTLQQLGDVFGISRGSVSSWESGVNVPDARKLVKLAEALGTTVEQLIAENANVDKRVVNFQEVPFYEWSQLSLENFRDKPCSSFAFPIHNNLSPKSFATRLPAPTGLEAQHPAVPYGSLVFVDPESTPMQNNFVLFKDANSGVHFSKVSIQKGNKSSLFVTLETNSNQLISIKELYFIGTAREWRISGVL